MIEIKGLKKSFSGNDILKGIDLTVEKGDVAAIIGPSGSGKTTLLRCLNFLEKADAGTMDFDGIQCDLSRMRAGQMRLLRKKTAFVFQNFNLFSNMTALKNVTLGLTAARGVPKKEAAERARLALEKVGLGDRCDFYPIQLSGGQQQRVAIARALVTEPEIIYFDEPTSALDPELIGEVLTVIKSLADEGMTMLVVTHEMNFARYVSKQVLFMENGLISYRGASKEFFDNPPGERVNTFLRTMSAWNIEE